MKFKQLVYISLIFWLVLCGCKADSLTDLIKPIDETESPSTQPEPEPACQAGETQITSCIAEISNSAIAAKTATCVDGNLDFGLCVASTCSEGYSINNDGSACIADTPPAEDPPTAAPRSLSDDVFFVGHSLVGPNMPVMLKELIASQSASSGTIDYQVINGSPLTYNWDQSSSAQGKDSRVEIPLGNHENLVITEAVPLLNHTTYSNTNQLALQFYNLSLNANPSSRVFLYETWHCLNSGTPTGCDYDIDDANSWRQRLTDDLPKWEAIANHVNTNNGGTQPDMLIVPAGQAMAKMYDEIAAGQVPGITNISQLFTDDIHPNDLGFYFVSAVQYATLYSRTPVGLPGELSNEYGSPYTAPSAALALKMQEIAWEVVCDYSRSGVTCEAP